MKLKPLPFLQIGSGQKTVELRLYDEKRRLIKIDDEIEFSNTEDSRLKIRARVRALHCFSDFQELFKTLEPEKHGGSPMSSYEEMYQYYDKENEARYGVVGIEIVLI